MAGAALPSAAPRSSHLGGLGRPHPGQAQDWQILIFFKTIFHSIVFSLRPDTSVQYIKNVAQIKGAFYIDALVVVIFSGGPLTYLPLIAVKCKHSWVWWGGARLRRVGPPM